jgi:ABC-type molybdate transport system permease subunit
VAGADAFLVSGFASVFASVFAPLGFALQSTFFSAGFLPAVLKSVAYQPLPFSWKPAALSSFL